MRNIQYHHKFGELYRLLQRKIYQAKERELAAVPKITTVPSKSLIRLWEKYDKARQDFDAAQEALGKTSWDYLRPMSVTHPDMKQKKIIEDKYLAKETELHYQFALLLSELTKEKSKEFMDFLSKFQGELE